MSAGPPGTPARLASLRWRSIPLALGVGGVPDAALKGCATEGCATRAPDDHLTTRRMIAGCRCTRRPSTSRPSCTCSTRRSIPFSTTTISRSGRAPVTRWASAPAEWEKCRDELIEQLQEAGEWAEREQAIVESDVPRPPVDSEDGPEFLPSHPTLALLQSAMEEHIEQEERRRRRRRRTPRTTRETTNGRPPFSPPRPQVAVGPLPSPARPRTRQGRLHPARTSRRLSLRAGRAGDGGAGQRLGHRQRRSGRGRAADRVAPSGPRHPPGRRLLLRDAARDGAQLSQHVARLRPSWRTLLGAQRQPRHVQRRRGLLQARAAGARPARQLLRAAQPALAARGARLRVRQPQLHPSADRVARRAVRRPGAFHPADASPSASRRSASAGTRSKNGWIPI